MASERREFARLLRKQSTKAEDILWQRLRGSRLQGAKFLRRVPFERFVVDFYCHVAKLVVELDGKQHEWFADYDAERTRILESRGVTVIRFTNAEVEGNLDSGLANRCERPSTEGAVPSPPAPLPNGRGGRDRNDRLTGFH
jgi:very-short-patch-repair endonuclease